MKEPVILYSIQSYLAYYINTTYYGDRHYVWCAPFFDSNKEEEYKRLEELAYGSYRLISVYCRDCVFGKKITVIPGVDEAAKQLRHIGNNLNQLTWRVNEGTLTAVNLEETKKELAKIFELLNEKMKGA